MRKSKPPVSAAELLAKLHRDAGWTVQQAEREQEEAAARESSRAEEAELISDLKEVGVNVHSVWDLVNSTRPYPEAIETLTRHLRRSYRPSIREGIARALIVPYAGTRRTLEVLIDQYKNLNDGSENSLKWVIGNSLSIIARSPEFIEDVVSIITNPMHGRARDMMILRLPSLIGSDRARPLLLKLSSDLAQVAPLTESRRRAPSSRG